MSEALAECARETKDIDNPAELSDAAYNLLSKKLGDNPGLFKAACQVYNSCKSIHKLSEADDKTRGNSFSILDVQELSSRLAQDSAKNIRKAASAPAVFSTVPGRRNSGAGNTLTKTASEKKQKIENSKVTLPDDFDYKNHLRDAVQDMESLIHKYSSALTKAERNANLAFERFVTAFATETKHVRKEAAARLHANFGVMADELIKQFDSVRPLHKLASAEYVGKYRGTPSLPSTGIYKLAMESMLASEELKQAEEAYHTAVSEVANEATSLTRKYLALSKSAGATGMAVAATGGASAGAGGAISRLLFGESPTSQESLRRKIYTTELSNELISLGSKRAFMHAVQNPTISKYALHKILSAYNKAIAQLPANARLVPATANQQLIESLMIDALATGSVPSKADAEVISTLANTLGKMQTSQGIYEGNNPDVA